MNLKCAKGNYIIQYLSIRFSEELTLGGLGGLDLLTVQKLHSKKIKPRIMYRMELNRGQCSATDITNNREIQLNTCYKCLNIA